MRQNLEQGVKAWPGKLSEVDEERRGYLRLAAKGHMSDEELDEALAELAESRETRERELKALQGHRKVVEGLEQDRDALLDSHASMVPEQLDLLRPGERHQVYKVLRLRVSTYQDGTLEVSGVFGDSFVSENQHQRVQVAQDQI